MRPSRDSACCQDFLALEEQANPEGWRIFRRQARAGQDFAGPDAIARAARMAATAQLNARARPWI